MDHVLVEQRSRGTGGQRRVAHRVGDALQSFSNRKRMMDGPGLLMNAANFGKTVVKYLADGGKHVTDEVSLARLSVYAHCPSLDPQLMRCKERTCGCRLKTKARWRSETCRLKKWPSA